MGTQRAETEREPVDPWRQRLAPLTTFLELGGRLVALTSVLAALFYYFGFARSKALFLHFGIDLSILNFQTTDYILLSIEGMTQPLIWILTTLLVLIGLHALLMRWISQPRAGPPGRRAALLWKAILVLGIALMVAEWGLTGYAGKLVELYGDAGRLLYPASWTLSCALMAYALWLADTTAPEAEPGRPAVDPRIALPEAVIAKLAKARPARPADVSGARRLSLWVLAGLLLYGLFWLVAIAANVAGKARAEYIANYLDDQPSVVLYSEKDLHLQASGVREDVSCPTADSCWRTYSGLRLLVRADHKYFLLPANWKKGQAGQAMTIIIPEADTLRIEVAPGQSP